METGLPRARDAANVSASPEHLALHRQAYESMHTLCFGPTQLSTFSLSGIDKKRARKGRVQPEAWETGDVSASLEPAAS